MIINYAGISPDFSTALLSQKTGKIQLQEIITKIIKPQKNGQVRK